MKKTSWADGLGNFTKGTMIVCGVLLVIVSVAVMILMFFPIQKEDHPTVVVEPARHTEFSATTHATTGRTELASTEPHTLSTWNAGVHGFNPDVNEHLGNKNTRYTTTLAEGEIPFLMPATTTRPETTTATIYQTERETALGYSPSPEQLPAEEPTEMTAPPLPVEVE